MLLLFLRPGPRERWLLPRLAGLEVDELVRVGGLASSSRGGLEDEWVVAADSARLSPAADGSWSSSVSSESSESVSNVRKEAALAEVDGWVGCWRSLLGGGDGEGDGELRESRERVELAIGDDDDEQGALNGCCVGKQRKRMGACARITFRVHPFLGCIILSYLQHSSRSRLPSAFYTPCIKVANNVCLLPLYNLEVEIMARQLTLNLPEKAAS